MPTALPLSIAALLALGLTATLHAAPDEAAYGRDNQYPRGSRDDWWQQRHLVGAQSAMGELFAARTVAAGDQPRALKPGGALEDWQPARQYLDTHPATGLLIVKDGTVLLERYQYGRSAGDRFTSWSMAKTVVGLAVGIAVAEGRIASIDDPLDKYEPGLAASAWKGVSIRQALNMASGVRFDEAYDKPGSDIARFSRAWTRGEGRFIDALGAMEQRDAEPGSRFKYSSADSQALGQALAAAVGRPLADYVSEKLWVPMGAEADASWLVDASGMEAAYCCLNARLRDYARLGMLLLDKGQVDGRRIVSAAWIEAATSVRLRDWHLQPRRATPYFGYGYQIWVFPDELGFALLGVRGQAVFVHPPSRLVMVQTAVWPTSNDPALGRQRDMFWRDLVLRAARL